MKRYLYTLVLLLLSLYSNAQRYGKLWDMIEARDSERYVSEDNTHLYVFLLIALAIIGYIVLLCKYIYDNANKIYLSLIANIKRLFFSKWIYIPLYLIWITLHIICLNVAKDRKPYKIWNEETSSLIYPSAEECFYPLTHIIDGMGTNEPLYAYDYYEFIFYGFFFPFISIVIYLVLRKLIKNIWLDSIYIYLTIWLFLSFIIAVIFYSDGSECGFWLGWLPSVFLAALYLDKKEKYNNNLKQK